MHKFLFLLVLASFALLGLACASEPTATPVPTRPAAPTLAPTAMPQPEPTAMPEPEPTAAPTPAPTAMPQPEPTATATPAPTATPTPTATPRPAPTATPESPPTATPEPTAAPTTGPDPEPVSEEDLTRTYVQQAIDFYEQNGRDATVAHYRSAESVENGRSLTLIAVDEGTLLVYFIPALQGQYVGPGSSFPAFQRLITNATEGGAWETTRGINRATRQEEPRRLLAVLHNGLVFASAHSVLQQNVEDSTTEYVNKAIARYTQEGPEATIAHYNSQDSLDGQFYLFLIGADDN